FFFTLQFESAYKPKTLRNWEVPKAFPVTPRRRIGKTRVISNERGHILPDIKKGKKPPWGEFLGTWSLPRTIDKKTAVQLNKSDKDKRFSALSNRDKENEVVQHGLNNEQVPYVPGDLTEEKHRPDSHELLAENRFNDKPTEPHPGFPKYRDDFSRKSPEPPRTLDDQVAEVLNNCGKDTMVTNSEERKKTGILSPIRTAISNFVLAKKLHKENLEHNPLPDTITDSIYRKLQLQRMLEPGLTLPDENYACGVGWKGHPGYGPNKCTKLKIYRPKTCALHPKKDHLDDRPSSVGSFERKWRFIRQNKVNPIDLAICWDLCPENVADEPKPPAHIDGSNGSQAPAVFSLVHTPKDEGDNERVPKCDGVHGCGPIFDHGAKANQEKEFIFDRPKTSKCSSETSGKSEKKRSKSAHDRQEENKPAGGNSSSCSSSSAKGKRTHHRHRSTPNLSELSGEKSETPPCKQHSCKKLGKRLCVACELNKLPREQGAKQKTEYKMAFKAGVPQKFNREKREDYPEHWRLATVYQHSYKPPHLRKRSLLQTVYK
ncbi:uncharacterized protein LOC126737997, partial [Anthonomus grandis grandis]|uniref:uncharacterized protein LOC126737997 n=1 Tax=Anthonomus grandis grandis TaxID=2921223 RepID=UPI002165D802